MCSLPTEGRHSTEHNGSLCLLLNQDESCGVGAAIAVAGRSVLAPAMCTCTLDKVVG